MAKRCAGDRAITLTAPLSDAGGRGSDLAVTAPELNAGAGMGRLGFEASSAEFASHWRQRTKSQRVASMLRRLGICCFQFHGLMALLSSDFVSSLGQTINPR
jgi:hypothetical protein